MGHSLLQRYFKLDSLQLYKLKKEQLFATQEKFYFEVDFKSSLAKVFVLFVKEI